MRTCINVAETDHSIIETCRLKNVVIIYPNNMEEYQKKVMPEENINQEFRLKKNGWKKTWFNLRNKSKEINE